MCTNELKAPLAPALISIPLAPALMEVTLKNTARKNGKIRGDKFQI